jgi:hypothetical protein
VHALRSLGSRLPNDEEELLVMAVELDPEAGLSPPSALLLI